MNPFNLLDALEENHSLDIEQYECLLENFSAGLPDLASCAAEKARRLKQKFYSNKIYIRGLIEISSFCKNDCYYCGIRRSNKNAGRYRLTPEEIFLCAEEGYALGFRTFVLQGGEDAYFSDGVLVPLLERIKTAFPDTAVTLSLGERSYKSYETLFKAGADRYLLRHETASPEHYAKLHPKEMSWSNRMECLKNLRKIGYVVGAGFMVGSPFQTVRDLCTDLKFVEEFAPEMCGIGPYIPHKDTPFCNRQPGSAELTCFLLSLIRLIKPNVLLPATTALGTLLPDGRERGINAGANVIMPNLSPVGVRKKYSLYDGKICMGEEGAQCVQCVARRMESVGSEIVVDRGDPAAAQ